MDDIEEKDSDNGNGHQVPVRAETDDYSQSETTHDSDSVEGNDEERNDSEIVSSDTIPPLMLQDDMKTSEGNSAFTVVPPTTVTEQWTAEADNNVGEHSTPQPPAWTFSAPTQPLPHSDTDQSISVQGTNPVPTWGNVTAATPLANPVPNTPLPVTLDNQENSSREIPSSTVPVQDEILMPENDGIRNVTDNTDRVGSQFPPAGEASLENQTESGNDTGILSSPVNQESIFSTESTEGGVAQEIGDAPQAVENGMSNTENKNLESKEATRSTPVEEYALNLSSPPGGGGAEVINPVPIPQVSTGNSALDSPPYVPFSAPLSQDNVRTNQLNIPVASIPNIAPSYSPSFGPIGKYRMSGVVILLSILTLGIYAIAWNYKINREMSDFDPRLTVKPGASTWAIFLPWLACIAVTIADAVRILFQSTLVQLGITVPLSIFHAQLILGTLVLAPYVILLFPWSLVAVVMTVERVRSVQEHVGISLNDQCRPVRAAWWLVFPVLGGLIFMVKVQGWLNRVWEHVAPPASTRLRR